MKAESDLCNSSVLEVFWIFYDFAPITENAKNLYVQVGYFVFLNNIYYKVNIDNFGYKVEDTHRKKQRFCTNKINKISFSIIFV